MITPGDAVAILAMIMLGLLFFIIGAQGRDYSALLRARMNRLAVEQGLREGITPREVRAKWKAAYEEFRKWEGML
jgi:hypothetical protein